MRAAILGLAPSGTPLNEASRQLAQQGRRTSKILCSAAQDRDSRKHWGKRRVPGNGRLSIASHGQLEDPADHRGLGFVNALLDVRALLTPVCVDATAE